MATNDELFDTEPPPPAYELNNAELDRKLADAAQRSLAIEQEQRQRPALPPLDEDGFPIWSEELFNYNQAMRQREAEAASAKLQSEYTRLAPSGSSGSASTSSPPPANQSRPLSGTLNLKQKEGRFGWLDGASQQIQQDEDDSHDQLNIGRPPRSPPRTQNAGHRPSIQVHVGPRPHDVLAQPQSPVSDPDDDLPIPTNNRMSTPLSRAPTYHPTNQTHPAPAPGLQRSDTRTSLDSTRSELPAWTAEAPSLDGPAYEEVEGGGRARRSTSTEERRQPAQVPVQARAHIQERVGGARRSATGAGTGVPYSAPSAPLSSHPPVPPAPAPVRPEARNAPRPSFAPTQSAPAVPHRSWTSPANTATSYTSAGHTLPASVVRPSPGSFNPSIAYRPAQRYNPTNMADPASPGGILEAQKDLIDGGVGVLYNAAVAATMKSSATSFKALPPPPNRMMSVPEDDASSVFSGRSGNGGGGVSAARMSVHSGDGPNRAGYVSPGAGQGYQGFQTGGQGQGFQMGGQGQGYQPAQAQGYQPAIGAQGYQPQPQPGAFNPIRMSVMPTQPVVQPGYAPGGYQPNPGASRPLPHGPGFAPTTAQAGFVAPPPPPGMMQPAGVGGFVQPGRKHAKLYKRL